MLTLSYLHFFCFVSYLYMAAWIFFRNRKARPALAASALFACLAVWSLGFTFIHNPIVSLTTAHAFNILSPLGGIPFSGMFFWFTVAFTGNQRLQKPIVLIPMTIIFPSIFLIVQYMFDAILRLDAHASVWFGWNLIFSYTPWMYVYFVYAYAGLLIGFALLIAYTFRSKDRLYRRQGMVIIGGGLISLNFGALILFFTQFSGINMPYIADIAVFFWAFGIFYTMARYQLFRLTPEYAAENILATMSDGLLLVDISGKIVRANRSALDLLGYSVIQLVDQPITSIINLQERRKFQALWQMKLTEPDTTHHLEVELINSYGKEIATKLSLSSTMESQGVVCIIRNLTAEKASQAENARLEDALRQAQKLEAIGRLAGGIAHDFNNMLGAILGYADLIQIKIAPENPQLQKYISGIIGAAQRSTALTGNLLAFARKAKFEMSPIILHDVITNAIELMAHALDRRIEIAADLTVPDAVIMGDVTQLQNALLNCAMNARDAMPNGGKLNVSSRLVHIDETFIATKAYKIRPADYIKLTITDTGEGMDAETKFRAFEPFFTTKSPGKGTGLGLASVYGTVKGHGGFVELESERGKGTSISIFLPITAESPQTMITPPVDIHTGKGTVLLVDDEEFVRDMASELLRCMGYDVAACEDGVQAIEYYRDHYQQIDLVILDMIMPKMNGRECFSQLKSISPKAKVIIASGYADGQEYEQVLNNGAMAFIKKPFTADGLSKVVADAIRTNAND